MGHNGSQGGKGFAVSSARYSCRHSDVQMCSLEPIEVVLRLWALFRRRRSRGADAKFTHPSTCMLKCRSVACECSRTWDLLIALFLTASPAYCGRCNRLGRGLDKVPWWPSTSPGRNSTNPRSKYRKKAGKHSPRTVHFVEPRLASHSFMAMLWLSP
ncbi:hypothetical protein P280DRAFT_67615 [Massarina eburnea CBS 473.64]|uniref:Uncharacterized protein n=1 Tax=Massarina eburnea CBS 473.64 TaxID=1395130 RepID=A0A6A6RUZ2_9PLEO|nr:hypothetical protein P280DRAFT_67615 [Massarina eburnea CBS 473.64]